MSQSQAVLLLLKAQKKLNTSPGWFSFGSNDAQYEESGDLFQQAANQFKIEKRFKEAGDAFKNEAECREKMNELNEASNAWWNAAKAYKQGYPDCNYVSIGTLNTSVNRVSSGY
jgi:alpha-soluble NSF attachment protein